MGVPGEDDADEREQSVLVDSGKPHLVVGFEVDVCDEVRDRAGEQVWEM